MPSNKRKSRATKNSAAQADPCPEAAQENSEDCPVASELLLAVAEQKPERVQECIARGDDLDASPLKACTPLILAIKLGNFGIVKLLVDSGASCYEHNENGMTLLHHAALVGHAEIAHFLCKAEGAPLDQCNQAGCTALYQAAQNGHCDCVKTFIDMGANTEARTRTGATPLYIASDRGTLDVVEVLLNAGCDANVRTQLQMTPLLVAAFNGHVDVIQSLLSHDVDIEQHGPCGGTALYVAAQEGRHAVAELLLEKGAKVDAACDGQLTPSLIAAMQGHADMVRLLLTARSDLGVRTDKGSTLGIMAARHGQTEVLKVLVEVAGVSIFEDKNTEGLCALTASRAGHHLETTAYIEGAIAAKKEADLNAWEASLPDILQEFATPMKGPGKSKKSKRKAKVSDKILLDELTVAEDVCTDAHIVLGCVSVNAESGDSLVVSPSESHGSAANACAHASELPGSTVTDVTETAQCGEWLPVKRKGEKKVAAPPASKVEEPPAPTVASPMKVVVATTTTTTLPTTTTTSLTPTAASSKRPSALPSSMFIRPASAEPKMRQRLAPMLVSAPATPSSAHPTTPCTTSPFGLPSPFGIAGGSKLWPATPDPFGPHGSPGMWAALPPSAFEAAPLFLPESFHPNNHPTSNFNPFLPAFLPPPSFSNVDLPSSFMPAYLPPALSTFDLDQFQQTVFASSRLSHNSEDSVVAQVGTTASRWSSVLQPEPESYSAASLLLE